MVRGTLAVVLVVALIMGGCLKIPGQPDGKADLVIEGAADEGTSQNTHRVNVPADITGYTICADGDARYMSLSMHMGPQADGDLSPSDGDLPYCTTREVDTEHTEWILAVRTIGGGDYRIRVWW